LRANTLQFSFSQAAYELFLPQELKKRCESPVSASALEIGKLPGLAPVETQDKGAVTSRAAQLVRQGATRIIAVGVYFLEQFDNRGRRQLNAGEMIEPNRSACEAQFDRQRAMIVTFESLCLHRLAAIGATQPGGGIGF
jgi:hypothetical protein